MRVLFLDHFPLASSPSGRHLRAIANLLQALGHEARALIVADGPQPPEAFTLRTMLCDPGNASLGRPTVGPHVDVPFSLPRFAPVAAGQRAFEDLSESELADYREALRRRLDEEIADFDPQLIHVQHVWLGGQLALESGAPYVLTAWGPELDTAARDPRYQPLVDQAAENASRILAVDDRVARRLQGRFDTLGERVLIAPPEQVENAAAFDLASLYDRVLRERYGC